jgi:AraC-like DNA-binding protein
MPDATSRPGLAKESSWWTSCAPPHCGAIGRSCNPSAGTRTSCCAVGLSSRDLDDHDHFILRRTVQELLELTAERLACPDFGLRLAGVQDIYVLGPLAFAIRNARDLSDALATLEQYVGHHMPAVSVTVETLADGDERIVFRSHAERIEAAAQARELAIAALFHIVSSLTSHVVRPSRVQFQHQSVAPIETYKAHFGLIPEFGMSADGIVVKRGDLRAPIANADPELKAIVERFLDANAPMATERADEQVRYVLCRLMRLGETSLTDVAEVLRMRPRALQRRLSALRTTFTRIRDDVRRDLAEIYLAHPAIPIAHVAQLLGYRNQSELTRSCLRWFGETPAAIRSRVE